MTALGDVLEIDELVGVGHRGARGRRVVAAALVDPEPVSGMPHGLAVLPAAAAMLRWKLHGNDR